jgi:hypothetical protein
MTDDQDRLVHMFRVFIPEFRGESAVYTRLAELCAAQPALATPLLAAPWRQRRALLLFAGAQYLLRTKATGHPLAGYFPTLGGERAPDDALADAFADLVTAYSAELAQLCATRRTQTNEARRCAVLRPALTLAGAGRPVGLVELGTSAGLLLLPDRYGYHYVGAGRDERVGWPDAAGPLVFGCAVQGEEFPDPVLQPTPQIASRVGIDLSPIDAADEDAVTWLRCLIWPEHVERLARLDAALGEVRAQRPRILTGDMLVHVGPAVSEVDSAALPLVFTSQALTYLPREVQVKMIATLAELGARRDLAVVLNEAPRCGLQLVSADAPPLGELERDAPLTLVVWRDGTPSVRCLATVGPHGARLAWHPIDLPYKPAT